MKSQKKCNLDSNPEIYSFFSGVQEKMLSGPLSNEAPEKSQRIPRKK